MKSNFDKALKFLLASEGGYVNNLSDPGGMTNLGVTKSTWEEYVGHAVNEKAMRGLTQAMVTPLYKRKYWDKVQGDDLPTAIDYVCFDAAVNSGPGRSIKWLQGVIGVDMDGSLGPKTFAAINAYDPKDLIQDYSKRRLSFLQDLPNWIHFGKGWTKRVQDVEANALTMLTL